MLPLVLERRSTVPLAAQIAAEIRRFVAEGVLEGDEALPSTRTLAQQLGVARGTVVAAYDQLAGEGYLVAQPGGATRIHPGAGSRLVPAVSPRGPMTFPRVLEQGRATENDGSHRTRSADPSHIIDLTPSSRPHQRLDDPAWREAWRKAATAPTLGARGSTAAGLPELRVAIAEHLRLMRAMVVDPSSIVVTGGARDGLALVLAALGDEVSPVAVESPGYPGLHRVLRRRGVEVATSLIDADGVIPTQLPPGSRSVLVTPNHLFPVGGSMPAARRIELLRHCSAHGLLIIEDDFDSDFRHVGAPLPTLRDLNPQAVVHLGTFSEVLTADAGIGYIIAPDAVRDALIRASEDLGPGAPGIAQRAVADFLRSGGLRRRITRRRRELIRRRDLLLEELSGVPVEMISGAHAVVWLDSASCVRAVIECCTQQGVLVGDLAGYWGGTGADNGNGIVLQCADITHEQLLRALRVIRQAVA